MNQTSPSQWYKFAEKVRLAVESSLDSHYERGTSGLELEFNILDGDLKPVVRVGSGPESRSFADYLQGERLPEWVRGRFQLEVFNWMTEAATVPYYSSVATVAEARLLEGALLNTLADLGLSFGERFFALHGNIPGPVDTSADSIPDGWNLARKRYLARCVDMYGNRLATAGIHTNHSFPEALLSLDFFHQPASRRAGQTLEDYRNHAVIRATRLLRPYCPVFIAVSATSPLAWEQVDGRFEIVATDVDSHRLLTFPNPEALDVPGLYSSHEEYLQISYELVRSGRRFGANNWTPIRARSDVEPVNRNILTTSEQLRELYGKGIYALGEMGSLEEAERALTIENLCARVDLPMNRVEVRTDEGGDSFDLAVAKVVFKELLMLRIYGEASSGESYRYDANDLARARRNEDLAARKGLDATVEHPHTGEAVTVRQMLAAALDEVGPLAEGLEYTELLEPLREMAGGGPNPAQAMRSWFGQRNRSGRSGSSGAPVIPRELLQEWLDERAKELARDAVRIDADRRLAGAEADKLAPILNGLRSMSAERAGLPVSLEQPRPPARISAHEGLVGDVLELAAALIRIPSITNCPDERVDEIFRCARFTAGVLSEAGAEVRLFDGGRYPAILAGFPGGLLAPVTLHGHLDVVPPEPGPEQLEPRVEGDYLWGRGAADMKTVVASYLVWMRRVLAAGPPFPPLNLLLVGNEENGEAEAFGTPHVLADLHMGHDWAPQLMIMGERTGEAGDERFGSVCTENRGVVRMTLTARGHRSHTGMGTLPAGVLERLVEMSATVSSIFQRHLTLDSGDGWESSARFPFLNVGEAGVYNLSAGEGVLGIEVRPVPQDDISGLLEAMGDLASGAGMDLGVEVNQAGMVCPRDNPWLHHLLASVEKVSGEPAQVGRKLAGTSARFAPGGNAVVWGQTGIGPHTRDERHFIPSIEPYVKVLDELARSLLESGSGTAQSK